MYKKRLNKRLIIIFLILFPTAMLFGFLNNVRAGTDIPDKTDDPENRNGWTWGVGTDDELAYEVEIIMTDNETGDLYWQMRYLDILRISDIDSDFFEFMGEYDNMSYVEAKRYYYECYPEGGGDVVEILDSKGYPIKDLISVFGFNNSDTIKEKFIAQTESRYYPPLLLPLNDSGICPTMHDIIYEGQIKYFENIYCNVFNDRGLETVDTKRDKIWFQNTTEDYFMNCTYFRINGTLESAEAYFLMNMGEGNGGPIGWIAINLTMTRVYGPDYCAAITDEVVWNFDVGDDFYFGFNADEYMITITNKTWCMSFETHVMDLVIPQPYNAVNASLSKWDKELEDYSIYEGEEIIAVANNYYPFPIEALFEGGGPVVAVPDGTDAEDMAFILNNFTMVEWPYEVYIANNGKTIELTDKEVGGTMSLQYDDLGIMKIGYMEFGGWLRGIYFRKNMTILEDSVRYDIELYSDLIGSNTVFINNLTLEGDTELYWAALPVNPLEPEYGAFKYEIPGLELYLDIYTNNTKLISSNPNITIYYDTDALDNLKIPESELKVYKFDMVTHIWEEHVGNYTINSGEINITNIDSVYHTIGAKESWNWSQELYDYVEGGSDNNLMIYETFGNVSAEVFGEDMLAGLVMPFVKQNILNLTEIGEETKEWGGETYKFNQINSTMLYWKPEEGSLVQEEDKGTFILAEYNYSASRLDFPFLYSSCEYMLNLPIVVPLRFGKLYLKTIGISINETFYNSEFLRDVSFPIWDEIYSNPLTNTLIFNETSSEYFIELTYYNNGTLKEAEFKVKFEVPKDGGPETQLIEFELICTRKFDYNTTNKVEWGVIEGNSYYFGTNFKGGATVEVNITIVDINQTALNLAYIFGFDEDDEFTTNIFDSWLTWDTIWGEIWIWNVLSKKWEYETTTIIAAANNYYPFFMFSGEEFMLPLILPKGVSAQDLIDTYKDFIAFGSLMMYAEAFHYLGATSSVGEVTEEYLRIDITAPEYPTFDCYIEWYLDLDTGVSRFWYSYFYYPGEMTFPWILAAFRKNHTGEYVAGPMIKKFEFDTYLVDPINASVVIESPGPYDFFEAILNRNPVNGSLSGNPIFYTDLFLINTSSELYNLTFYIYLPEIYNLNYFKSIAVYMITGYDEDSGMYLGEWETMNFDDPDIPVEIIKYTHNNTLVLIGVGFPVGMPILLAWLYSPPGAVSDGDGDGKDKEKEAAIPGYDIYLLLGVIALLSVALILKRKKIFKK